MFVQHCDKNNDLCVLFIVCVANLYYMKILDKFQSEIRTHSVCKSNSDSNFKTEVQKFRLRLTSKI